jgi:hypothetical protein
LDKKIKRSHHILVEKLDDVYGRLELPPRKLLEKLPQQDQVSASSTRTATKLLKLLPFKRTQCVY